jgi:hypothetical protein
MSIYDYFPFLQRPAPRFVTESGAEVYGVMAEFETPAAVYHAAEKVRDAGYSEWDVYSPFPIHGMEQAMGVKKTILPVFVAAGAFTGAGLAYLLQWWVTAVNFPVVVQGKPTWAWEPFTPIVFELGVLCSAFTALLSMLALNGLPRWHHPLFAKDRFLRCSQDRFCIAIEAVDAKFNPQSARSLLQQAGATAVELVEA